MSLNAYVSLHSTESLKPMKNYFKEFKELSRWSKIGAIGALASIIAIPIAVYLHFASYQSENHKVNSTKTPTTASGRSNLSIAGKESEQNNTGSRNVNRGTVLQSGKFSGLTEIQPILDNSLFIGRTYNDVVFGGRNLNLLKLDMRTYDGKAVEWKVEKDYDHGKVIKIYYDKSPYIEFEYRGKFYAVEFGRDFTSSTYKVKSIAKPTLQLGSMGIKPK